MNNQRERLRIEVDDRESASAVLPVLRECADFHVTVMRLPLGDYRVDGRFLFERKTLTDLVAAIKDGRLFRQALRLAATPLRPAIILEGTGRELAGCGMQWEAIQGALVTVTLFCGLPLLRTRTPEETVRTMLFVARQGRTFASGAMARRGRRPRGKRALQLYILQGFPGIGPDRAQRLLDRFGSVEAIVRADGADLRAVPGIGERLAGALRWSVEEPDCGYKPAPRPSQYDARSGRFDGDLLGFQSCLDGCRCERPVLRCQFHGEPDGKFEIRRIISGEIVLPGEIQ